MKNKNYNPIKRKLKNNNFNRTDNKVKINKKYTFPKININAFQYYMVYKIDENEN